MPIPIIAGAILIWSALFGGMTVAFVNQENSPFIDTNIVTGIVSLDSSTTTQSRSEETTSASDMDDRDASIPLYLQTARTLEKRLASHLRIPEYVDTSSTTLSLIAADTASEDSVNNRSAQTKVALTQSESSLKSSLKKVLTGDEKTVATLVIVSDEAGIITSSPSGIACGTGCSYEFRIGTKVTLSAVPTKGATFAGWMGGCSGTASTCIITLTKSAVVGADFQAPLVETPELNTTATGTAMSSDEVAKHSSDSDCWITVSGKIYSVASYIAMHPGGRSTIVNLCGKDATDGFTTRGGTGAHSSSAWTMLGTYFLGSIGETVTVPKPVDPNLPYIPKFPPTTINPPAQSSGYSSAELARHSSATDCWIAVNGNVYSVAPYLSMHPGGRTVITNLCGMDASSQFGNRGGTGSHSSSAWIMLGNYLVGPMSSGQTAQTPVTPTQPTTPTTPTQPVQPGSNAVLTTTEIAKHTSATDCYIIVSSKVYSVASYLALHPGGKTVITNQCGKDATAVFTSRGNTGSHSSSAWNMLGAYFIGNVGQAPTAPTTPTAPQTPTTAYSATDVSRHAASSDCWIVVNSTVYSIAGYISSHPGGRSAITNLCGKDATNGFTTRGGDGRHSTKAWNMLGTFAIGTYSGGTVSTGGQTGGTTVSPSPTPTPAPTTPAKKRRPRKDDDD